MRFIFVLAALLTFSASTFAGDKLSPGAFVGQYNLVEPKYGLLCDERLQVLSSNSLDKNSDAVLIDVGPWAFTNVNGGRYEFDNGYSKGWQESYTTEDSLISLSKTVLSSGQVDTEFTQVKLSGNYLYIVARSSFRFPGADKISSTCFFVTFPTLVLLGTPEPFSIFAALRKRTEAGGVFVMNVNERSEYTEMITGMIIPCASLVAALNALQNSMMFTPR